MKKSIRLLALVAVLALVAAACGEDDATTPAPVGASDQQSLPPNSGDTPAPNPAGTCLEGETECNDTPGGVPSDLPPPVDAGLSTGQLVDGGLTVADALASTATGVIGVKGFLVADAQGARLCELLAESFPPQCGGAAIAVTGYEEMISVPVVTAQGVTWTDEYASFLGEIVDGVFVVDPTASG